MHEIHLFNHIIYPSSYHNPYFVSSYFNFHKGYFLNLRR